MAGHAMLSVFFKIGSSFLMFVFLLSPLYLPAADRRFSTMLHSRSIILLLNNIFFNTQENAPDSYPNSGLIMSAKGNTIWTGGIYQ